MAHLDLVPSSYILYSRKQHLVRYDILGQEYWRLVLSAGFCFCVVAQLRRYPPTDFARGFQPGAVMPANLLHLSRTTILNARKEIMRKGWVL